MIVSASLLLLVGSTISGMLLVGDKYGIDVLPLVAAFLLIWSGLALFDSKKATTRPGSHQARTVGLRRLQLVVGIGMAPLSPVIAANSSVFDLFAVAALVLLTFAWLSLEGQAKLASRDGMPSPGWREGFLAVWNGLGLHLGGVHVATLLILAVCSVPIGTAYGLTASRLDWPSLGELRATASVGSPSARTSHDDIENADEPPSALTPSVLGSSLVRSPAASPTASCLLEPKAFFQSVGSRVVADGLFQAWVQFGSNEVGCPESVLHERRKTLAVLLRGGEADPSVAVSDHLGRAAVVFAPLVTRLKQFLNRDMLLYTGERVSFGLGDYQVFFLRDTRCSLSARSTYASKYINIPPSATKLLIDEATRRGQFPFVLQAQSTSRGMTLVIRFDGNQKERLERLFVRSDGRSWFANNPGFVGRPNDPCPDLSAMLLLAQRLEEKVAQRK